MADNHACGDKSKGKIVNGPKPNPKPKAKSDSSSVEDDQESRQDTNVDDTQGAVILDNLYYNNISSAELQDTEFYHSVSVPAYSSKLERDQMPQPILLNKLLPQEHSSSPMDSECSRNNFQLDEGLQPGQTKNDGKSPFLMLICLVVNFVVVMAAMVAVVFAFVLIASIKADITSLSSECPTAEPGSFESRLKSFDSDILKFLQISLTELTELRESSSNRVESLEGVVMAASNLVTDLYMTLNDTNENIEALQEYLNNRTVDISDVNNKFIIIGSKIYDVADQVARMTEDITNSSAIQFASDIQSFYVFGSCDNVTSFKFPFPTGTYRIGSSQDDYSLKRCSTSTALTCNGISGQWRRVAYLDTSQTNFECPGSLQTITNPTSCRIFGSSPTCSSVLFSSGDIPYSQVCGRVYGRYSNTPDAFDTLPGNRPDSPTIDDNYVDGVSLSYSMNPRNHVWTLAATIPQYSREDGCTSCNYLVPGFVGSDYSCHIVPDCNSLSDDSTCRLVAVWNDDNLCNGDNIFYRNLTQTTTEDLEMRLCRDQTESDEDISISFIEIFVSAP